MTHPLHGVRLSRLSVGEIRRLVAEEAPDESLRERLANDPRAGVRRLTCPAEAEHGRSEKNAERRRELSAIERTLKKEGFTIIAGVDEAGRGPLAGPVAAGCAILPDDADLPGLDDSKKMTPKSRERVYDMIVNTALAWKVVMADHLDIDELGILGAVLKAMREAVERLPLRPDMAIIDGNSTPGLACRERAIIDGDARCLSIAAASVLAKVTRDRFMIEMDARWPGYGFAGHKGYGCRSHLDAIGRLGPCEIHRFSFHHVIEDAPEGTVRAALEARFRAAGSLSDLDRAARGVRRNGDRIGEPTLDHLREVYRECRTRLA